MTKFFVEPAQLAQQNPALTGENAKHAKVLRLKAGEEVLICDGEGNECLCAVESEENQMIDFITNYWAIIIALIAVVILGIILVKKFLDKPTAEQIVTDLKLL